MMIDNILLHCYGLTKQEFDEKLAEFKKLDIDPNKELSRLEKDNRDLTCALLVAKCMEELI